MFISIALSLSVSVTIEISTPQEGLLLRLSHWVAVYPCPSWDVKYPAQIAVVVACLAVVPAVALAPIIGIMAVGDEMIGEDQIPASWECEIDAVSVLPRRIVLQSIVAAVIGQMNPLSVRWDIVVLQKVVIAVEG